MSFPDSPTLAAWVKAWGHACTGMRCDGMAPYFLNSVLKVVPAVIISTALGAVTGYVLTKWRFPGSELIRAAKIDGASFWQIFVRIILPISGPIIVVVVIWQFTHIWNDFLVGVAFSNTDTKPITVALNNMVNSSDTVKEYNVDMAAAQEVLSRDDVDDERGQSGAQRGRHADIVLLHRVRGVHHGAQRDGDRLRRGAGDG